MSGGVVAQMEESKTKLSLLVHWEKHYRVAHNYNFAEENYILLNEDLHRLAGYSLHFWWLAIIVVRFRSIRCSWRYVIFSL